MGINQADKGIVVLVADTVFRMKKDTANYRKLSGINMFTKNRLIQR